MTPLQNIVVSTSWFYGWVIKRRSAIGFIVAGIKVGQGSVAISLKQRLRMP